MRIIRFFVMGLLVSNLLFTFNSMAEGQVMSKSSLVTREKVGGMIGVRVAPPNEDFAFWMPKSPTLEIKRLVVDQRPTTISCYVVSQNGADYAVLSISGLDNGKTDLAHMLMLNLYNEVIASFSTDASHRFDAQLKAIYQQDLSVAGYPGRQYSLQARERTGLWHLYAKEGKFYAVAALTDGNNDDVTNHFLTSFNLVSAKSVAKAAEPPQPKPVLNAPRTARIPSSSGTWLVILRTFAKSERSKAHQKISLLKNSGHEAQILDTDNYPNLKNGFLVVAMGPYSKTAAQGVLNRIRSVAPESYLKSGW